MNCSALGRPGSAARFYLYQALGQVHLWWVLPEAGEHHAGRLHEQGLLGNRRQAVPSPQLTVSLSDIGISRAWVFSGPPLTPVSRREGRLPKLSRVPGSEELP